MPISLHLEVDNYKPDLMLPAKNNPKVFECYRYLPPGNHRYFFTDGKETKVADDQKSIMNDGIKSPKKEKIEIKKNFKFSLDLKNILPEELMPKKSSNARTKTNRD